MKRATDTLHIRINRQLKRQFKLACKLKGITHSQQMIVMISDFIAKGDIAQVLDRK